MFNSVLIFISLLLSTKFMIFSAYEILPYTLLLSNLISFYIIIKNREEILRINGERKCALILFFLALCVINISKLNYTVTIKDIIYPTDIHILFSFLSICLLPKKTIVTSVKLYLNFIAIIVVIGVVAYFLNMFHVISPSGIIRAPDHANQSGYSSLYSLAYYPSWITLPFGFKRFTSIFWEPGTFGLYLIFLLCIEQVFIREKNELYQSKIRIVIFIVAGILSFSVLFYVMLFVYLVISVNWMKRSNIILLIISVIIFIVMYDKLYELILYRFAYDPNRGFVGNNRSGALSFYLTSIHNGHWINVLFGFSSNAIFGADSTPIFIKIYQRGIIGFLFLFFGYLILAIKSKYIKYLIIMLLSFVILAQIEGALSMLFFILALLGHKYNKIHNKGMG
ncbi:hypothetical protein [Photobacterium iliopiscarium]|uniref:O-antigen ligase domain-containing protein n=1 Tax=Photobacterium iliopiscarium TaxID=56192 RepID=A0A2T3MNS3_9GAMM|nr:hypothetical protein [Photobacterium iliopiscarium]PSV98577.1 hypothetical protein C9I88_03865 [Photobacterium iliopiscarium]